MKVFRPWLFAITTSLSAALGSAQAPAAADPVPQVVAAPPVTNLKPPAPNAVGTPKEPSGFPLRAYGILWSSIFATQPVQSYGLPTAVAPTAAVNPAVFQDADHTQLSFQIQQTRLGMVVGEGTPFKGTVEIDFVHFDQSSPSVQAYPRIRIGLLEWGYKPNQKFFMGQSWDLFGNATGASLLSHSFNLVGTLFQAGNIGFMRQQLGWAARFGDLEIAVAAGMQGTNTGPSFNNIEASDAPTGAARIMYYLPNNHGVVGASGIATSLRFSKDDDISRRGAGGGVLFADVTLARLNVHSELYLAQNLANTGALNLSQGRFDANLADAGGYFSGRYTVGQHAITAMYGAAAVLRPSDVVPGYIAAIPASMGVTAMAAAPNAAAGPGITYNMTGHVGYWYSPLKGLSIVLEPYVYATKFKLAAADVGRFDSKNVSWGASFGSMYQF